MLNPHVFGAGTDALVWVPGLSCPKAPESAGIASVLVRIC